MEQLRIFCAGATAACRHACDYLKSLGFALCGEPDADVNYLLLDTPGFQPDGSLRCGGEIEPLLARLPQDIIVCGGNLSHPGLQGYGVVDFLRDEEYLCSNARITAECALDVAMPLMGRMFYRCPVLIIGWGRIGKCLGQILKALEADVTIAVRDAKQQAMLRALGYRALLISELPDELPHCRLIFNTVPAPVLNKEALSLCRDNCVKIELASRSGLEGDDIVIARGLPGIHMPESSGKLIADTFLRLVKRR